MKRSAQVALVLMGVTGTTAAGAYMMPPRPECQPAPRPAASATVNPPQALNPGPATAAEQPCRRRSWSGWRWSSSGSSYSSYSSSSDGPYRRTTSNYRRSTAPTAVSTALTSTGRSSSSSGSSPSRGGFGSTGHAMSGGHSGS